MTAIKYRTADVDGFKIFYREAGAAGRAEAAAAARLPERRPHVPRPHPASGRSLPHRRPRPAGLRQLRHAGPRRIASTGSRRSIDRFTEIVGFDRYAVYVFDYGAPTGFRLAVKHPDRITAIISQNGNAYEEGLSEGWNPIRAYWQDPSAGQPRGAARFPEARDDRLAVHARRPRRDERLAGRLLARQFLSGPARRRRGAARPVRRLQEQRRALSDLPDAISGPTSRPSWRCGARTIRSSCRRAPRRSSAISRMRSCAFFDTGHFALETHAAEIAAAIRDFLPW